MRWWLAALGMSVATIGCSRGPSTPAAAGAPRPTEARHPAERRHGDSAGSGQDPVRGSEEGLHLHRRAHRRSRREPAEMDSPAEHLQQRRRHSRIGRDGQGLLRAARLPGGARLRRRHHRMGRAGQSGGLREVRLRRAAHDRDLLAVRHDAGHAARRLEGAALRGAHRRAGAVQEGADRPRRHELQRPRDGAVERADVDQGGHRQAAGEPRLRRRRRRGAHGHRPAQVRQGSPRVLQERRCADRRGRRAGAERRRRRRRRIGRLRLLRADHERQGVGPRSRCSPTFTARTSGRWTARRGAT